MASVACLVLAGAGDAPPGPQDAGKYIGAAKCKNCHGDQASGDQFTAWNASQHATALGTLASEEALRIAKERGIEDPQTSEKCVRCHVTAYGLPEDRIKKGFDPGQGVQCESCHGPGDAHMKARFLAAASQKGEVQYTSVPADEITTSPPLATCLGCHNEESPTYKPFCFKDRWERIQHLNPRKPRTPEELEAMKCKCPDPCQCVQGDCGAPYGGS